MARYIFVTLAFLFIHPTIFSQTATEREGNIVIGRADSLYSRVLEEHREFWVYVPSSARDSLKKFPVLYLLDGDAHFYSVAGMMRQLGEVNGNSIVPETVVVAIHNTNRARDLTPTTVEYIPGSGGAGEFTQFIEKELIPYIDSKYNTSSYRSLIGHSWGALFVLNTLLKHPQLFDNYVSIDPGIRWDALKFLAEAKITLANKNFDRKSLFLGVANRLPRGLDLKTVKADRNKNSEHMRKMLEFVESANGSESLNFQWQFYPDDSHQSVPLVSTYDALRFLFPWYSFDEEVLFDREQSMGAAEFIEMVKAHFSNISDHFGYRVIPDQRLIDRLGDASLSIGDRDKANALYQMNIMHYGYSPYPYEALGDFYRRGGEVENAKEQYLKSLKIEENPRVRRKLARLGNED